MVDWAKYLRTKGAIKLHLLLDDDGYLPSFAVVTEGKTSEIKVARTLRFAPGTILAIDRGYIDYVWFRELTQEEVYFVTRMKERAVYEVQEELQVPQNSNVVRDQIICFLRSVFRAAVALLSIELGGVADCVHALKSGPAPCCRKREVWRLRSRTSPHSAKFRASGTSTGAPQLSAK